MQFEVKIQKRNRIGSLTKSIEYMKGLGVILAMEVEETGIDASMMRLSVGEGLTLDDAEGKEVCVTRIG